MSLGIPVGVPGTTGVVVRNELPENLVRVADEKCSQQQGRHGF